MQPFTTQRRVEFRDTDAAGIIHFSTYFVFMEQAEHDLLRSIGLSVFMEEEDAKISFPRVSASCEFFRPVRFEDVVDIDVDVERLGEKSVTFGFQFKHNGQRIAAGRMTTVCCRIDVHPPTSIAVPAEIADKLMKYLRD